MTARLRPIDLVELRGLCLAVELGSLGRAAAAMGISQPALSKRMRELELFAGAELLTRTPRGVTPTPGGVGLYREARALLAHAESVEAVLDSLRGRAVPIRLAASHTISEYMLPAALAAYRERVAAGPAVELVAANSDVVRDLVRERRADLGLAATAPDALALGPELVERPLGADEVVAAVPTGHPWSAGRRVALERFLVTPMVMRDPSANTRQVLDAALRERGLRAAEPLSEVGSTAVAVATAVSHGAPAVLSARAVDAAPSLTAVRVDGLALTRTFALVRRRDTPGNAAHEALAEHLAQTLAT